LGKICALTRGRWLPGWPYAHREDRVRSPSQHAGSGILYVAAWLPPPGRDGTGAAEQLTEIDELITAAGGRYGGYLRASLPPFWATTDATAVRAALERLTRA